MKLIKKEYIRFNNETIDLDYIKVNGVDIPIIAKNIDEILIENIEKELRYYKVYKEINNEFLTSIANYLYENKWDFKAKDMEDIFEEFNFEKIIEVSNIEELEKLAFENYGDGFILNYKEENKLPIFLLISKRKSILVDNKNHIIKTLKSNLDIVNTFDLIEKLKYIQGIELLKDNMKTRKEKKDVIKSGWYRVANPILIKIESKDIVERELYENVKLSVLYHENSKLRSFHQQGDFMKPVDEIDDTVKKFTLKGRKRFEGKTSVQLPGPSKENRVTIEEAVLLRRSRRHYSDKPISLQVLSNILFYSYGITGKLKNTSLNLRAVPSGGGLYPMDVYLAIKNVEGLKVGVYYYNPFDHELVMINTEDMSKLSNELSGYSLMLDKAAFTVILSANFWRNQWKYHERGYRVILIDCGHLAQNIHLMATSYNLGSCCLMGFVDDEINKLLEIDGVVEHSMYLITIGNNETA